MPTILRIAGYRLYFWSHEPNEPPHVHVDRGGASAKIWVDNLTLASRNSVTYCGLCERIGRSLWRHGMASSVQATTADIRVQSVAVTDDELSVALMDGRRISVPLAWYPRLANATPAGRSHWEIAGGGLRIH